MCGDDARTDHLPKLELKYTRLHELSSIIKAVSFREAIAYLPNDLFSKFNLRERSVHFRLPLVLITECIAMHTDSVATFKMIYSGDTDPVKLVLEEDSLVVDMDVKLLTVEEVLDFEFDTDDVAFQAIMKTYMLKEAFKELDVTSTTATLSFSSDEFLLITKGNIGTVKTKFPRHSQQIERLECAVPFKHQYLIAFLKRMSAALAAASKCSPSIQG
ncbi:repair protein Rad1/Rec1/Rad17 [Dictyocaulus viviparus]|uniref:Repair protein Rad1/Rec1/Rad17 n=1 Tax=Dictyocaulus viviparus TaxID=29172 RepID=A0A0D8Y1D4_DICVI|nr:repair protein Rad1/Rec1/Rad17 [Dictyocaulus viviparus]